MECCKSCLINIYLLITLPLAISGLNDTTLIIAKDNGLLKFDLQTEDSVSLIRQGVPYAIDYIQESDKNFRLYWSDTSDHTIYSGLLHNNGLRNASPVIKSKNGAIEGIAVDRLAKHLYWINSGLGIIEVSTLDGSFQSPLVTGLIKPRALAVDSLAGLLFWSDWNEKNPHIGRSTLSGSNHSIIVNVNSTKSGWINAIALVPSSKKIYWVDAKSYSIYEATYHGHSIRRIFHKGNLLRRAMGLHILHDKIYWSCDNGGTSRIYEFGIGSDESPMKVIYESYAKLHGIASLHHEINTQNPCADNRFGCSHLCLLNGKTPACHCPYGTSIGNDNKTCQHVASSHTTVKTSTMYSTETNSSSSADVNYNATQAVDYFLYDYSTENMDALEQNDTCSQNCSNNGHCVKTSSGQEMCDCLPPFWGKNCEHVSCDCHYGKCIMQNNKIQCLCDEGVKGFLCNKYKCRDHCYKGKCKLVDGEPFCDCLNGWIGPRCNRPVPNEMRYKESNISIGDREFMIIEQNHLKIFGMKVSSIIIEFVIAVQFVILILMSYCLISRQFRKESDHVADEAVYNQRLQKRDPDSDEYGCEKHKKHGVVGIMKKLKKWLNNNNARETKNNLPCGNPDNVELLHKEKSPSETTV